ncbi:type VII toxin-antitoxin system HepT family RNase toxin [Desnuesiella massiliensis]|uniref:type VII toxin-antitoxin system HepT family RNase toxin n=1 Tax=Desnuesiella massiliensis TaxID=1650662 RepID=UPI0006E20A35|nr:DUF86 domain-containing protein [Desnuesiella massiliensis]
MVKRDVIISRLDKLNEYIKYLNSVKNIDKDKYLKEPMIYGSSERFLHLSIECVLDIANHLISDLNFRRPESNRDIFEILYENRVIDELLKNSLCNMASFRNILVHDYLKLNRGIVYDIIINSLKDIEKFEGIIMGYL